MSLKHLYALMDIGCFDRCRQCHREVLIKNIDCIVVSKNVDLPRRTRGKKTYPARHYERFQAVRACTWCRESIEAAERQRPA